MQPHINATARWRWFAAAFVCATLAAVSGVSAADADAVEDRPLAFAPRGVVVAISRAALSTDLAVPALEVAFREGERFRQGDTLVRFDCRRHEAELRAAEATHREMSLTLQNNVYLKRRRAIGQHDVEIAEARVKKAKAEVDAIRARLTQCTVEAPFDGTVSELGLFAFETAPTGRPFMRIMSNAALEIEVIVLSRWLTWLKPGEPFAFEVDELGETIMARVVRVSGAVDPVSQTVKLYATVARGLEGLRAGMSGTAHFKRADRAPDGARQ